ncbi:glutamyl-Q tRNA(Asp) synthetase [Palleronia aestuarii]|uniref:Glutamyl-Q tRNA(Asp) synthetase n=2 Tax=Palleronia aestuarii TaxID=568105 RepID=A0A2W7P988_9RHOB|nr:glutamyl-Q tRNA(Asp) synthetase [Palleronia aestuarii]
MLLRIEDTDTTRSRVEHAADIVDDLTWLGISWEGPVRRQSEHLDAYDEALRTLGARGLLYPCSCTRRDIIDAGAKAGLDGFVYPGTCRKRPMRSLRPGDALRLNLRRALSEIPGSPAYEEDGPLHAGTHRLDVSLLLDRIGDPVLKRRGSGDIAYHLACPHDDALQGVTHVIRGADLWHATPIHVLLQSIFGWPIPRYHHHDLIRDASGRRLAKVDLSKAISRYRAEGATPEDIRAMLPPLPGA